MPESWAAQWAGQWTASASRFNANHGAAGSGHGGQFVSAGGGGGAKTAKSAGKVSAHQAHVAHVAHEQHLAAVGGRQAQKRQLHARAEADRAEAKKLEQQLHGLLQQEHAAKIAAAKSAAAAKPGHQARVAAAKKAAQHRKAAPAKASLKTRISELQTRISGLLSQAKALDAQAARL